MLNTRIDGGWFGYDFGRAVRPRRPILLGALASDRLLAGQQRVAALESQLTDLRFAYDQALAGGLALDSSVANEITAHAAEADELARSLNATEDAGFSAWQRWASDLESRVRQTAARFDASVGGASSTQRTRVVLSFVAAFVAAAGIGYAVMKGVR